MTAPITGRPGGAHPAATVAIEPMRWWDVEQVALLETVLFPTDSPWTPAMFWSELADGHHYVVHRGPVRESGAATGPGHDVADPHGAAPGGHPPAAEVLGYAGLALGPDAADVHTIGVSPLAQHRGIGRALLRDLLTAAGDLPVLLEVRCDNERAIALYASEGFSRIGLRRRYYHPSGADAYTMRRPSGGLR